MLARVKFCAKIFCPNGQKCSQKNKIAKKKAKNAKSAKIAEIVNIAKIAETAETEIVRFLETFKIWVFFGEKWAFRNLDFFKNL